MAFGDDLPVLAKDATLRDLFAAKAMGSIGEDVHSVVYHVQKCADGLVLSNAENMEKARELAVDIAAAVYVIADAMLAEREKGGTK